jgi:predicted permease
MEILLQDIRYALRMLVKNAGFTAIIVLVMGLSIGAFSSIFSVVSAVLIRPLPYEDPDRLVVIWETNSRRGINRSVVSSGNFIDWREQNHVFEETSPWRFWYFNLTGTDEPERIQGLLVSSNFFHLLGARAALGRTFLPEEEQAGKEKVVILSNSLWQRRFGSDPAIIGNSVTIDGEPYTVVGVMQPQFRFIKVLNRDLELWVPLVLDPKQASRDDRSINVYARLKRGVTLAQGQAEMDAIASGLEQQYPDTNAGRGVSLVVLQDSYGERVHSTLLILLAASIFVVLIACTNVANLMLARATTRQKEMAVRMALGASRLRLVRQLLTESLILAVLGGIAGLLIAAMGINLLNSLIPDSVVLRVDRFQLDGRVLGYTLVATFAAGLLFGLTPGLIASRVDLVRPLKEGGPGSTGSKAGRTRKLLVVVQVALAVILMIGAGLMVRSSLRLQEVDRGFNPDNLLTAQIWLSKSKYSEPHQVADFYRQTLERLEGTLGIESVGAINFLPLGRLADSVSFTVEGAEPPPGEKLASRYYVIAPDYFHTLRVPLLDGRLFTQQDADPSNGGVIINETMARRYCPEGSPIGRRIKVEFPKAKAPWRPETNNPWLTIVGVVGDVREDGLMDGPFPQMYLCYLQYPSPLMNVVMRTASDPVQSGVTLRNGVWAVDRHQPIFNMKTMKDIIAETFAQPHVIVLLLGTFAVLALVLAAVGIYGVMSYSITQLTREIGIRMALGAQVSDVLKLVVGQGVRLVLAGVAIGLIGAFVVTRALSSLLFGVSATDLTTFLIVAVILATVATVASYFPARRAALIDPIGALRHE